VSVQGVFCKLGLHDWEEKVTVISHSPMSLEVLVDTVCRNCGELGDRRSDIADPQHDQRIKALAKQAGWQPYEHKELVLLDEWGDRIHSWPVYNYDQVLDALNASLTIAPAQVAGERADG